MQGIQIMNLNAYGGAVAELVPFIKRSAENGVKIFCLQEVYNNAEGKENHPKFKGFANMNLLQDLQEVLPGYTCYFKSQIMDYFGNVIFVHKSIGVKKEGQIWVYKNEGWYEGAEDNVKDYARSLQYITFTYKGAKHTIFNFHGYYAGPGVGKGDSAIRIDIAVNVLKVLIQRAFGRKILVGDLNLWPDTSSIAVIEGSKLKNVFPNIDNTRSELYKNGQKDVSDYIFVDPRIRIKNAVIALDRVVSDHLPMLIEI